MLLTDVENVAQTLAGVLTHKWETLDESQRRIYRMLAFRWYEAMHSAYLTGIEEARDELQDIIAANTIKNRFSGLTDALHAVDDLLILKTETFVDVPDAVPDNLLVPDPYADIEAGSASPYVDDKDECGVVHPSGWTCTRPPHPTTWKHFDDDLYEHDDKRYVNAVWEHDSEVLLSVRPELFEED